MMTESSLASVWGVLQTRGIDIALSLIGAFAIWVIGRMAIRGILRMLDKALAKRGTETTLARYARSSLSVALTIVLLIAVLSVFGVETTSFAAVIAAGGVAIGLAWSGLLANFAAGVFLLILKPFKVGDLIAGGGVIGTIKEVGLFATTIETTDGVITFVGNNKLFADNIQNMTSSHTRRVDLVAQLAHGVDIEDARRRLLTKLAEMPAVLADPPPSVEILEFNAMGTVLAVRPFTDNASYWDVYFATNRMIQQTFGAAGYPVPYTEQHLMDARRAHA
jgi:small conductance mechanosensitive channel